MFIFDCKCQLIEKYSRVGFRLAFFSIIDTYISISTDFWSLFHKPIWKETNLDFRTYLESLLQRLKTAWVLLKYILPRDRHPGLHWSKDAGWKGLHLRNGWKTSLPPMNKSHWNLSSEVVQRHSLTTGFQVSLLAPCKHLYKWMSPETIDLIQQIMAPEQFSTVNSQTWQRRELLLPQVKRYRHPLQSIVQHPLQSMNRCWDNQAFSRNIS